MENSELSETVRTFDARTWAKSFNETLVALGYQPHDEGWLIGWFANSIMCGYDEASRRAERSQLVPMREKIYFKAMNKWGKQLQIVMLMEECAELQKICSKIIRNNSYPPDLVALAEELADVHIMMEQISLMFLGSIAGWNGLKKEKLDRLSKLLIKGQDNEAK